MELLCSPRDPPSAKWLSEGCDYRAIFTEGPKRVGCKNGVPYDCKCNKIAAPYSMAYEARDCGRKARNTCPSPGVWYMRAPPHLRRT